MTSAPPLSGFVLMLLGSRITDATDLTYCGSPPSALNSPRRILATCVRELSSSINGSENSQ
ncbi:MAG: hypothetical protein HC925_04465 [Coleofasciculaceae cyanobacterium SM2_3_26]|nr:hypothetical protein [Coleofasciculaceae cyanobacterium SM2_3_26]